MLSPSCRLAKKPLITYRLSNVSITTAERSRPISREINGLYKFIRLIYQRYSLGLFFIIYLLAKLGTLNYLICVINQPARLIALFLDSRHFLTQPTARKTRSGDPAPNR